VKSLRTITLILSILGTSLILKGSDLDSLRSVAEKPEIDTVSVLACYEIAADLWYEDVREASYFAEKGFEYADKLDWEKGRALMLRNLAAIASIKGDYAASLIKNTKALTYYKSAGDTTAVGKIYNNMAISYADLGLDTLALEYYRRSEEIFEQVNDFDMLSTIYNNTGVVLQTMGESESSYLDSARNYFDKSLSIAQELKDTVMISFNYVNIGYIYKSLEDYPQALDYFQKSKELNLIAGSDAMIANDHSSMAEVLIEMGEYDSARALLQWSLPVIEGQELRPLALDVYKCLSIIYENTGDIEKALMYQKNYSNLRDSMAAEDNEQVLLNLQAQQKDLEITSLDQENQSKSIALESEQLKNNMLRLITVGLVISLFFALYQFWRRSVANEKLGEQNQNIKQQSDRIERQNQELIEKNQKLDDLNQEIGYLIKVVAHDLTAPLGRIKGLVELVRMEKPELSDSQQNYLEKMFSSTDRLERLIRSILNNQAIESGQVKLQMEPQPVTDVMSHVIRNYKPIAAEKSIDIESQISTNGALAMIDRNMTTQVFENLISNAIKFSPKHTVVNVRLVEEDSKIKAEISDMGPGLTSEDKNKLFGRFQKLSAKPTANESSYGLGLSIVKKLVTSMNGKVYCESTEGSGANFVVEFDKISRPK